MSRFVPGATKEIADIFEDSEDDMTFYGFSDTELRDTDSVIEFKAQGGISPMEKEATSQPSVEPQPFKLRVALRPATSSQQSSDDEVAEEEDMETTDSRKVKRPRKTSKKTTKKRRPNKVEDEEIAVTLPPLSEERRGSDSGDDVTDTFLVKREQNIKDNKAMLAQLMADLEKMSGGPGFLKKQAGKQEMKNKSSHPPRSGETRRESRRNPERASRRQTRSMAVTEGPSFPEKVDVALNLEEELLDVRRAPRPRGTPRSNQNRPHIIRPVENITEDELQLVADSMTDKVYNSVTGSTCHQCRQKTVDTKTCCRNGECRGIQGQFCGPCLRNRYGEDVRKALLDPDWNCPPCRGICNCSFCRQREGRCPTGILFPLAQYYGFSDVHSYLSSLRDKLKGEENVEM